MSSTSLSPAKYEYLSSPSSNVVLKSNLPVNPPSSSGTLAINQCYVLLHMEIAFQLEVDEKH